MVSTSRPYYLSWNPWRELARWQRDMNRLFQNTDNQSVSTSSPAFNVWQKDHEVLITAEIPGLTTDSLDISIHGHTVTISGKRPAADVPEGARVQRQERPTGSFTRTFKLPFRADTEATEAKYENGWLSVKLPIAAQDRPQKVSVKSAN